jgi:hypothetical protein
MCYIIKTGEMMKTKQWKYQNLFLGKHGIMSTHSKTKISLRDVLKAEFVEDDGKIIIAEYKDEKLRFFYIKESGKLVIVRK